MSPLDRPEIGHEDLDDSIARAVASFQAGIEREKSFQVLVDRFYRPVKGFFAKRVPAEDCLDLTQETFLCLYKGLEGFRWEARLATWLFRIAHTTHLRWLRRRQTRQDAGQEAPGRLAGPPAASEDHEPVAVAGDRSPQERVLHQEHLKLLREAIEELPAKMQRCLKLRVYQELSYQAIADFQGISIQTVKAHLFQARQKLETRLKGTLGEIDF